MSFAHEQLQQKLKMLKGNNIFSKEKEKEFDEFIDTLEGKKII